MGAAAPGRGAEKIGHPHCDIKKKRTQIPGIVMAHVEIEQEEDRVAALGPAPV